MKRIITFLILLCSLSVFAQVPYVEILVLSEGDKAGSVWYHPQKFEAGKTYPLLFVLHGIGEQGDGKLTKLKFLAGHKNYGPAETFGKQYGFIIVEPQADNNWEHGEVDETLARVKADTISKWINWKKVYLTGTSLGGGGTYQYLSTHPNAETIFAAASPSGSGGHQWFVTSVDREKVVVNSKVPTWAFHNVGDPVVWPEASTLYFLKKKNEFGGTWPYWVSIMTFKDHTFPSFNRGKGSTLLDFKYVISPEYIWSPKVNLYEWLLMNEIGKIAVPPPIVTVTPPVPAPGTPRPPVDTVKPVPVPPTIGDIYIKDVNYALSKGFLAITWDNGVQVIKPATGDAILNVYDRIVSGKRVLTIDYSVAPNKTYGPKR